MFSPTSTMWLRTLDVSVPLLATELFRERGFRSGTGVDGTGSGTAAISTTGVMASSSSLKEGVDARELMDCAIWRRY